MIQEFNTCIRLFYHSQAVSSPAKVNQHLFFRGGALVPSLTTGRSSLSLIREISRRTDGSLIVREEATGEGPHVHRQRKPGDRAHAGHAAQ